MSNVQIDPLEVRSPDSAAMLPFWDLVDDLVTGVDRLRLAAVKYMPKFPGELEPDYEFRLSNAKMTNIYRDIVESLSQKPFEEEVRLATGEGVTHPPEIEAFMEDVDGTGNNATVFAAQTFFNAINSSIAWIFVDISNDGSVPIVTRADEKKAGIRVLWSNVMARNVLEVRSQIIGGKEEFTYFRIEEPGEPKRIRVMEKVGAVATWKVHKKQPVGSKENYVIESEGTFDIGVIPMVPVITGRRDGRRYYFYPPMRDAADLQKVLYKDESALAYIKILTAYPMLAGNGVKPEKDETGKPKSISVGPGRVLFAPSDGNGDHGEWSFIEPSSTSLTFLAGDIKEQQTQLREIGRQPLTAQSGNLTVITTAVAAQKARSAVAAWALALKNALENALVLTCRWVKIDYDPEVSVYSEFDNFADTTADLEALKAARDKGDLSQETYLYELKRRRVLSPEFDYESEVKRLLDEGQDEEEEYDANGNVVPIKTPIKAA